MATTSALVERQRRRAAGNQQAWDMALAEGQVPMIALQVATSGDWWPQRPWPAIQLFKCNRYLSQMCRPRIRRSIQLTLLGLRNQLAESESD